jgi:hypothetical protein
MFWLKKVMVTLMPAFFLVVVSLRVSAGSPTSNVELSYSGYEFLTAIFDKYDTDKDKALNPQVFLEPILRLFNLQLGRQDCSRLERFYIG